MTRRTRVACRRSLPPGSPKRVAALWRALALPLVSLCAGSLLACWHEGTAGHEGKSLLLALSVFESGPGGVKAGPARLVALSQSKGGWRFRSVDDPDSNVFHKAMAIDAALGGPGILTAGGSRAMLKVWRTGSAPLVVWEATFGGRFSRMRDVEVADLYGDGRPVLVVATHDQGVVAVVRPTAGAFSAEELDREADTIVHEVEVGDVDNDGTLEVYAARSLPNRMDGTPQPGSVVSYVPARGEGRRQVADLADRHAKEILVADVDGDGHDELYVSVEAVSGGVVEILRFDAGSLSTSGSRIATINDAMCRCLTAGDVDGDGRKELVAAAHKSGVWLLRPGHDQNQPWTATSIDRNSSSIEHAALLADLDDDGVDELYVANDSGLEVNRYVWRGGLPVKETIYRYPKGADFMTWNISPASGDLVFSPTGAQPAGSPAPGAALRP